MLMLVAVSMFAATVMVFGVWRVWIRETMSLDERGLGEGRRRSIFCWRSGVLGFCGWAASEAVMIVVAMARKRECPMSPTLWNFMDYSCREFGKCVSPFGHLDAS